MLRSLTLVLLLVGAPVLAQDGGQCLCPCPVTDAGTPAIDAGSPQTASAWLQVVGNKIKLNGQTWVGRGVNIHDTRGCNACTWSAPSVAEVKRRIDLALSWGATFFRLDLESYAAAEGRRHWAGINSDPAYLQDIVTIVDYIGSKNARVMVSLWINPSFNSLGHPTANTAPVWDKLAKTLGKRPHVLYGIVNEPQHNYDGKLNEQVWQAMKAMVDVIRAAEQSVGSPPHVIAVQGHGGWSRHLNYYVQKPIPGQNIAYEIHVYDTASYFPKMITEPAQKLPIIIGEYGPAQGMTATDVQKMLVLADQLEIPTLAWTMHQRCPPNLIVDKSNGGCGVGMDLQPTTFGNQVKAYLESKR